MFSSDWYMCKSLSLRSPMIYAWYPNSTFRARRLAWFLIYALQVVRAKTIRLTFRAQTRKWALTGEWWEPMRMSHTTALKILTKTLKYRKNGIMDMSCEYIWLVVHMIRWPGYKIRCDGNLHVPLNIIYVLSSYSEKTKYLDWTC